VPKDQTDFMITEYQQIAHAFFDLSRRTDSMFKFYVAIIGIPLPLLAALVSISGATALPSLGELPALTAVALLVAGAAGCMMSVIIAEIRFEAVFYAKTINRVRGYFSSMPDKEIAPFLVLPITDDMPNFYEGPARKGWRLGVGTIFLEILLMGFVNSSFLALGLLNLGFLGASIEWFAFLSSIRRIYLAFVLVIVITALHILAYYLRAHGRDKKWMSQGKTPPTKVPVPTASG